MWQLENTPGRTCLVEGKEFLFFSGYSYLGMNHVKEFCDLVKKGFDKYGILFPSSRISNTRLGLYEKFENNLSALTGMEKTVSFSSGYLAGKTIASIMSSYKNIFIAPGTHPAITIRGAKDLSCKNVEEWQQQVILAINSSVEKEFVLISDSINILEGIIHDFSFLKNISPGKKVFFLIDDSHGIGILGNKGEGITSSLPQIKNVEYIISYSLSKAFNIGGGAVSCSKRFGTLLEEHPGYSGSTAISPSLMYAFLKSNNLYAVQRDKLFENIQYLKKVVPAAFLNKNNIDLPMFICKNENAESQLYKNEIIISSFGYPYPASKKINRIIINSLHTKPDIDRLSKSIN